MKLWSNYSFSSACFQYSIKCIAVLYNIWTNTIYNMPHWIKMKCSSFEHQNFQTRGHPPFEIWLGMVTLIFAQRLIFLQDRIEIYYCQRIILKFYESRNPDHFLCLQAFAKKRLRICFSFIRTAALLQFLEADHFYALCYILLSDCLMSWLGIRMAELRRVCVWGLISVRHVAKQIWDGLPVVRPSYCLRKHHADLKKREIKHYGLLWLLHCWIEYSHQCNESCHSSS